MDTTLTAPTLSARRSCGARSQRVRCCAPKLDARRMCRFTFCLYHSEFKTFNDGDESNGKPATYGKDGVRIAGWAAARKKAAAMKEKCAALSARAKAAKLRKCMKGADVRIRFEC